MISRWLKGALVLLVTVSVAADVRAQDEEKELGWSLEAELSSVVTGGNSKSNTLGYQLVAIRTLKRSLFRVRTGGTETQSTLVTRSASGTEDDFTVEKVETTDKTAELYFARAFYEYDLRKHFFLFGGADWLRNRFAGIDSRYLIAGGAGNTWVDRETLRFQTFYSFTHTFQDDVVDNPFTKSDFPGVRFAYDLFAQLTESTEFKSDLILDLNLDNTDDVRIEFTNSLPISISERLFFQPSVTLLWRNEPALTEIALFDGGGTDTGTTVLTPLDELDTLFSLSLVVRL